MRVMWLLLSIGWVIFGLGAFSLLGGCSKSKEEKARVLNYVGFESYVDTFVDSSKKNHRPLEVSELVIRFGTAEEVKEKSKVSAALAICTTGSEVPTIVVDQQWWENKLPSLTESKSVAEEILFHELGHCLLNRKHLDGTAPGKEIPGSIMYPKYIPGKIYAENKQEYYRELFTGVWAVLRLFEENLALSKAPISYQTETEESTVD